MKKSLLFLLPALGLVALAGCTEGSEEPEEHVHSYEEGVYESDANGHWQVCVDDEETTEVATHVYTEGEYVATDDEDYHYTLCSVCEYVVASEEHTFYANGAQGSYINNEDDETHYDYCTSCNYQVVEEHTKAQISLTRWQCPYCWAQGDY